MNDDDQPQGQASGSVAHTYRNTLFWKWSRQMPKGLTSSFVAVLQSLAAASDPAGYVRFRDGKAIRIKDIAAASRVDEKDARRYLRAAVEAGVVAVKGEQRRGRSALYAIVLNPCPDWDAAVASLTSTRRKARHAPPWLGDPENGGVSPELDGVENGGLTPELSEDHGKGERGTHPRLRTGDSPPFGSGDSPPYIPGVIHGLSHDGVEVCSQPQVVGASEVPKIIDAHGKTNHHDDAPPDCVLCIHCRQPLIPDPRRPDRTAHARCTERHTA